MTVHSMLEALLSELPNKSRIELIKEFGRVYGAAPPVRISNAILTLAIANRLQEQAFGGLKPSVRKRLLNGSVSLPPKAASPGTLLIREWQGQKHVVTVHANHVEYLGKPYRSLTQVVFRITGQKRSGPLFFGLRSKAHAD